MTTPRDFEAEIAYALRVIESAQSLMNRRVNEITAIAETIASTRIHVKQLEVLQAEQSRKAGGK